MNASRNVAASLNSSESSSLYTCALLNMSSTAMRNSQMDAYPPGDLRHLAMERKSTGLAIWR